MTTPETELVVDRFARMTDAELDAEEGRIERGRHCCSRRQDLDRYNRRLVALTAERMRRTGEYRQSPTANGQAAINSQTH